MTHTSSAAAAALTPVKIFDTTLRDGEQSPGASMSLRDKLHIAASLDAMGVDVIEAGFPAASPGDFEAVSEIAAACAKSTVCALSRATPTDIEAATRALDKARAPRIHTFIATSPIHMERKLRMGENAVIEAIGRSVTQARRHADDVEWSAEDATRSDLAFLVRCVETAIESGATTINLPDTVGYAHPAEYAALFRNVIAAARGAENVVFSAHCHNDLGLAVANSIAAVQAGARQVECAVNGLGERAGNAALEEIVMALRVRRDTLPFETKADASKLSALSASVSRATGFPVQYNKAVVGKNAFAHESGIHQDGMLKDASTYEIMRPEDVGVAQTSLVMGKHSGRAALRDKLEALGYELGDAELKDAFARFKELADRKRHVFDDDLAALVDDQLSEAGAPILFKRLRVIAGTDGPQTAEIDLTVDGEARYAIARGNGPVDAVFKAVQQLIPHGARLGLYQVTAVTGETDSQAEASVRLETDAFMASGRAHDPDTLVASAKAYVQAVSRLEARRKRAGEIAGASARAAGGAPG